jgi:TolA-binding protein
VDAHRKLTFVVNRFPYTDATERAQALLDELTSDPTFQREQQAERTRRVSERLLAEADELLERGDAAGAREKWRQIIDQFPDSEFAQTAQEKLDESR